MTDEDGILVSRDATGCWAWAGVRLLPYLGLESGGPFPGESAEGRDERLARDEAAWLLAQWNAAAGTAFEIRFLTRPDVRRIDCAALVRVSATSEANARAAATAAAQQLAAVPAHVRSERIAEQRELHRWLVPFAIHPASLLEVRKTLTWAPCTRQDTGRRACIAVGGFGPHRTDWEALLRGLAAMPFRVMLSLGFAPFDSGPSFQAALTTLAQEYRLLAQPAVTSPIFSRSAPGDQFAANVAPLYAEACRRYIGRGYRARVAIAAEEALPAHLGELARAATGPGGGTVAVRPAAHEVSVAVANLGALSAYWLENTYAQQVPPQALGPVERVLADLVDARELQAVLRLPAHRPGRPELFSNLRQDPETMDTEWADARTPDDPGLHRNPFESSAPSELEL